MSSKPISPLGPPLAILTLDAAVTQPVDYEKILVERGGLPVKRHTGFFAQTILEDLFKRRDACDVLTPMFVGRPHADLQAEIFLDIAQDMASSRNPLVSTGFFKLPYQAVDEPVCTNIRPLVAFDYLRQHGDIGVTRLYNEEAASITMATLTDISDLLGSCHYTRRPDPKNWDQQPIQRLWGPH